MTADNKWQIHGSALKQESAYDRYITLCFLEVCRNLDSHMTMDDFVEHG